MKLRNKKTGDVENMKKILDEAFERERRKMTCNVCNPFMNIEDRRLPVDPEGEYCDEYWYVDIKNGNCRIIVDFDDGFGNQWIEHINYCPACGRRLN